MSFAPSLPHGPLTRIVDGVHLVRGRYPMGPGVIISRTMTVVETPDGLVLLNAVRLDDAGLAELDELGKVRHLVNGIVGRGVDFGLRRDRLGVSSS